MSSSFNTAALRSLLASALPALEDLQKSFDISEDNLITDFLKGLSPEGSSESFANIIQTLYEAADDITGDNNASSNADAATDNAATATIQSLLEAINSQTSIGWPATTQQLITDGLNTYWDSINQPRNQFSINSFDFLSWQRQIQPSLSDAARTYTTLIPTGTAAFTTVAQDGQRIYNGQGSAQPLKWSNTNNGQTNVTFAFDSDFGINGISFDGAKSLFVSALSTWSRYAPLSFQEIQDPGSGDRVDIYVQSSSIDGQGGTLAFAYFPIFGDITFDNTEQWNNDKFLETAVHELGHSLGLDHEGDVGAIMNPVLNNRFAGTNEPFLLQDDIDGIRYLYGGGQGTVNRLGQTEAPTEEFENSPLANNLVVNGSFEDTPVQADSTAVYSRIKGWTQLSGAGFRVDRRSATIDQAADGSALVELDVYGKNATIYQNVDTITGQTYTLSVDFTNNGRDQLSTEVDVFWEGQKVDRLTGGGLNRWKNYQFQVEGGDRNVSTLAFRSVGQVDSVGGFIDNISVVASANATANEITKQQEWGNSLQELGQSEASFSNSTPLPPATFVPELIASEHQIFPDAFIPV